MNEFDEMFNEIKKQWPQITAEQFGQACKNVLASAKPYDKMTMEEMFQKVRQEILRMNAK